MNQQEPRAKRYVKLSNDELERETLDCACNGLLRLAEQAIIKCSKNDHQAIRAFVTKQLESLRRSPRRRLTEVVAILDFCRRFETDDPRPFCELLQELNWNGVLRDLEPKGKAEREQFLNLDKRRDLAGAVQTVTVVSDAVFSFLNQSCAVVASELFNIELKRVKEEPARYSKEVALVLSFNAKADSVDPVSFDSFLKRIGWKKVGVYTGTTWKSFRNLRHRYQQILSDEQQAISTNNFS